jgi:hypothetical protein
LSVRVPVIVGSVLLVLAAGSAIWFLGAPAPPATSRVASPAAEPVVTPPAVGETPSSSGSAPVVPARGAAPRRSAAPPAAAIEPAPTTATLRVEADVPDASVFIDKIGIGTAPLTIPDLAPGSHRLDVQATGYDSHVETIELEPGPRTITVAFKVIRLDAKIDAIHKHGIGSCRGQITASPEGLRYNATDGKDNLSVTFTDLDAFEVDYLAKNLRVRTRQGRTLNFTDPDGIADRLFVFHRDVDKVRKRVIAERVVK